MGSDHDEADNTYANDVEAPTLPVSGAEGKVIRQWLVLQLGACDEGEGEAGLRTRAWCYSAAFDALFRSHTFHTFSHMLVPSHGATA